MPNLECWPHLLSTIIMTERKTQAQTASTTATEICGERVVEAATGACRGWVSSRSRE